jgi:glycosyltransferase involved in cell wall biosynthesis
MKVVVLIPAYNPSDELINLVLQLAHSGVAVVMVVDDGSAVEYSQVFATIGRMQGTVLLRHAVNLGKGAALKTGLNYAYCHFNENVGVVTMDADGQHQPDDVLMVARRLEDNPASLVLGVRVFGKETPFRSLIGNTITKFLFRIIVGQKLTDTQTGLRGIPMSLVPKLLKIEANGYEYEVEMLLACKHGKQSIIEEKIKTIYINGNRSSHFNPLADSMRIYFVLFRFSLTSILTAFIDYSVFLFIYNFGSSLLISQVLARSVAMLFNYTAVRRLVFFSDQAHVKTLPKYVTLVCVSGAIAYMLIDVFVTTLHFNVVSAKIGAELMIFLANFAIQRDFIFTRGTKEAKTDWDRYYVKPYKIALLTRKITQKTLLRLIQKYVSAHHGGRLTIVELGGASSCFFDAVRDKIQPAEYHIIDNNQLGLDQLRSHADYNTTVFTSREDVLNLRTMMSCDLSFSVGLIEHFVPADTKKAVAAHFRMLKPGGIAIISFPTPTLLYRASRFISEVLGLWIFHDERPLKKQEIAEAIRDHGTILHDEIIWPIFLTQMMVVARKNTAS